ncbi:deoxynucleoside kinase (plasmid) [Rossellomorea sp. AcN35-11]|nr:deoxynucleoside kinase [Rossellomorea aquimaris]WJV32411.1 deoxynucleoside kinase [Rossellomorea sp. AcN35-11]
MAGPIGAGKSSISELLGRELGYNVLYESVEDNPLLDKFYYDKKKWAFPLQIYFINSRYRASKKALTYEFSIMDRSIYEDAIFALLAYEQGNMTEIEYHTYLDLLDNILEDLEVTRNGRPKLLIYLSGSFETTLFRIAKRGREYEQQESDIAYYKALHRKYQEWIKTYDKSPVLTIDIDKYDISKPEDAVKVVELVNAKLNEINSVA